MLQNQNILYHGDAFANAQYWIAYASTVVDETLQVHDKLKFLISSVEGFIRQE